MLANVGFVLQCTNAHTHTHPPQLAIFAFVRLFIAFKIQTTDDTDTKNTCIIRKIECIFSLLCIVWTVCVCVAIMRVRYDKEKNKLRMAKKYSRECMKLICVKTAVLE